MGAVIETKMSDERILQEELQDLCSVSIHADHVRWVTKGPEAEAFDVFVRGLEQTWDGWADIVARCLVGLGFPPDARISSLTEGTFRSWLPADWMDIAQSGDWLKRELSTLSNWTRSRDEMLVDADTDGVLQIICEGLATQAHDVTLWLENALDAHDIVDEAGMESFPASDPPAY